jgi:hypothetical protein
VNPTDDLPPTPAGIDPGEDTVPTRIAVIGPREDIIEDAEVIEDSADQAPAAGFLACMEAGTDIALGGLFRWLAWQRPDNDVLNEIYDDMIAAERAGNDADRAGLTADADAYFADADAFEAEWRREHAAPHRSFITRWFVFLAAVATFIGLMWWQITVHSMWALIWLTVAVTLAATAIGGIARRRERSNTRAGRHDFVIARERGSDTDTAPDGDDITEDGVVVSFSKARRRFRTVADSQPPRWEPRDLDADDPEPVTAGGASWSLPPMSLLEYSGHHEIDRRAVADQGRVLETALKSHGIHVTLVGSVSGPTVTRFELEIGPGVKVARIISLQRDIAYAMAATDVRILAPIPGRHAIGVEVPNADRQIVTLGDILSAPKARVATHPLEVAVGRELDGRPVLANLATMPHVLIAGATGAGKSSCINSLLTSILMRSTPDQVRMILIDPKRVELGQYNRLPHLITQVVTDPKKAANALAWAVKEMERRYDLLAEAGFRDIGGYNKDAAEPLPYILVVVDELNDLMMVAARDVEESICRIAQMARAVGIHLVVATQRPSVNVITGVIKANIPARWAFTVSSGTDSKVILDQLGAERLIGQGDMLALAPSSSVPQRIQGCWVSEEEVRAVVKAWRNQSPHVDYDDEAVLGEQDESGPAAPDFDLPAEVDELLGDAVELVVRSQLGSTSMLQRKLRIGFARAEQLMDLLEQKGVVGPSNGGRSREVFMTPEELDGGPAPSAAPRAAPAPSAAPDRGLGAAAPAPAPLNLEPLRRVVEVVRFLDDGSGQPLATEVVAVLSRGPEHADIDSTNKLNDLLGEYGLGTVQRRQGDGTAPRRVLRGPCEDRLADLEHEQGGRV